MNEKQSRSAPLHHGLIKSQPGPQSSRLPVTRITFIPARYPNAATTNGLPGESAGGISPPAALRTGRDGLPSSGPHSPAVGERDELPVGEQVWLVLVGLLQPVRCPGVLAAEPFEFLHGPPDQVLVDAPCQEGQLGAVEGPVVADPAPDHGVDFPGEAGQVCAAAPVEVPVPDLLADRLSGLVADGRGEAGEVASPAFGQAAPEGVAQEVEAGVLVVF